MAKIIEIPGTVSVMVPKLGSTVSVTIPETTGDDVLLHIIHHGLKQKLVDSTAGINRADYDNDNDYRAAVQAAVNARLETILTVPSERAFGPRNPVETEARRLVAAFLLKAKVCAKAADAAERTSTFAKAESAFAEVVRAAAAKANPTATPTALDEIVARNWHKIIYGPAAAEVERRKAAVEGMALDL
jgi:glycerol-3-phosphate O-acyltransferase